MLYFTISNMSRMAKRFGLHFSNIHFAEIHGLSPPRTAPPRSVHFLFYISLKSKTRLPIYHHLFFI